MPYVTCDWCGKSYYQYPYYVGRYEHNFCCRRCSNSWSFSKAQKLNQIISINNEDKSVQMKIGHEGIIITLDQEDLERIEGKTLVNRPSPNMDFEILIGRPYKIGLARFLLNADKNQVVSYLDGNPLNCRKSNLKLISKSKRSETQRIGKNNKTGVKGVTWRSDRNQFRASITKNRIRYDLGSYRTLEEAKRAREEAEKILHKYGTFIKNFREKNLDMNQCKESEKGSTDEI